MSKVIQSSATQNPKYFFQEQSFAAGKMEGMRSYKIDIKPLFEVQEGGIYPQCRGKSRQGG